MILKTINVNFRFALIVFCSAFACPQASLSEEGVTARRDGGSSLNGRAAASCHPERSEGSPSAYRRTSSRAAARIAFGVHPPRTRPR